MQNNLHDNNEMPMLSGMEAVRAMPGMYIGGKNQFALHRAVWCLIGYAVNGMPSGYAGRISVTIEPENVFRISDNGPGIPVNIDPETGRSVLESVLTTVLSTRSQSHRRQEITIRHLLSYGGRLHDSVDVGLIAPNALAEQFIVKVKQDGHLWRIGYSRGKLKADLERIVALNNPTETGTSITFQPDFTVFEPADIDHNYMYRSLSELAFLIDWLTVTFEDKRLGMAHPLSSFNFPDGTSDFVRKLNRGYTPLHSPVRIQKTVTITDLADLELALEVDISMQYVDSQDCLILSFVNGQETSGSGSHVDAFLEALGSDTFGEQNILGGLTAVISIWYPAPGYAGSTKRKLEDPVLFEAIEELVRDELYELPSTIADAISAKRLSNEALNAQLHEKRRYSE